jgi:hypothetical protein
VKIKIPINSEGNVIANYPAFKKWFGSSKVVDATKRPLVVYHGSAHTFDTFDVNKISGVSMLSKQGSGFYFTDKRNASVYLKKSTEYGAGQVASKDSHLFCVYLSIKKPLHCTEYSNNITLEQANALYLGGDNAWFYSNWIPFILKGIAVDNRILTKDDLAKLDKKELVNLYADYLYNSTSEGGDCAILSNLHRAYKNNVLMFNKMRSILKADGLVFTDRHGSIFVAWDPNQIKAVDNNGQYSNEPNIYL